MASSAMSPTGTRRSLSPLPMTRTNPPARGQVLAVERQGLADAQAGRIEQLQQGAVAQADEVLASGCVEQLRHFLRIERIGQALHLARQVDERGDVRVDELLRVAEAVERPDRGRLATQAVRPQHARRRVIAPR